MEALTVAKESEDWRSKYKAAIKELEQSERYTQRVTQQLRQFIASVSRVLQGQSKELDRLLEQMATIPDDVEIRELRYFSNEFDKCVQALDTARLQQIQALTQVLSRWIERLQEADTQQRLTPHLSELHDSLPALGEQVPAVTRLLERLLEVQQQLLHPSSAASGAILERDCQQLLGAITQKLRELLENLRVPANRATHVSHLIQRLQEALPLQGLPEVLRELVELVKLAGAGLSDDFEDYLLSLNQQLSFVEQFLNENHRDECEATARYKAFNAHVRSDVQQIHHTVKVSDNLDNLKQSVTRQLAGIVRLMDQYRKEEEERETRLQTRYDALLDKVREMEQAAEEVKSRIEAEQHKARTDILTGLPNRIAYEEFIQREIERWKRYGTHFSLCVADLDHFKRVNDRYGHLAGDKVLKLIARTLANNLRASDFLSRFGGEEFIIVFPSTPTSEAVSATEKLRRAIEKSPFNFQGEPVQITMSFGITEIRQGDSAEQVFDRADSMLYKAKGAGRNLIRAG